MAVLDQAARDKMPKKDFAGPGTSFPIGDKSHARLAISGATRSEHAGNISSSEEDSIKAKARAKLGDGKSDPPMMDHKAAVAKMHPEHVHKMVQHAMSGKAGPEMQQMAQQAMQGPAPQPAEPAMAPKSSMFSGQSDNDADDMPAPASTGSMFSGGR